MTTVPRFLKSHGLGNDYLVLLDAFELSPERVRLLCDRHRGLGGDGILEPIPSARADQGLRIWNPDGSQAEKSGNGLRIFARYLCDHRGLAARHSIEVASGVVEAEVHEAGDVTVQMGRFTTSTEGVPVARELVDAVVEVGGQQLRLTAIGVGNPHCVAWFDHSVDLDALDWRRWGAALEVHPLFPNRTNVQFARPGEAGVLHARVWERGAGETQASGSSACAVASSASLLGLGSGALEVRMPGGSLWVTVHADRALTLRGDVEEVGMLHPRPDLLARLG